MMRKHMKKVVGLFLFFLLATSTGGGFTVPEAFADDWFFCDNARYQAQMCVSEYLSCGGLFNPGCWEAYEDCIAASGIDLCE